MTINNYLWFFFNINVDLYNINQQFMLIYMYKSATIVLATVSSTVEWHRYPYWVKLIPIGLSCYFGLSGLYWVMMQRGWTRAVKPWTVECHKGLCLVPIGIYFWGYTKDVLSVWPFRQGKNLITENIKIA